MIKRIMSIGSRSAPPDEKAKGWITILFLIVPALSGYYAIYSKITYWITPRNEGFYEITESGFVAMDAATVSLIIFALRCAISAAYARNNYSFSTYLKEAEKGYHEPIMSHSEPIEEEAEAARNIITYAETMNGTTFMRKRYMTTIEAMIHFAGCEFTDNQLRLLQDDHKGNSDLYEYFEQMKIRLSNSQQKPVPKTLPKGETVELPLLTGKHEGDNSRHPNLSRLQSPKRKM